MAGLWLCAQPCARLSARPTVVLASCILPSAASLRQPNITLPRSTSSVRHLSSSFALKSSGVSDSKNGGISGSTNGGISGSTNVQSRKAGILARILPSSLQPPENSSGGLRRLVSLMRPERKPLTIAVLLVRICILIVITSDVDCGSLDLIHS